MRGALTVLPSFSMCVCVCVCVFAPDGLSRCHLLVDDSEPDDHLGGILPPSNGLSDGRGDRLAHALLGVQLYRPDLPLDLLYGLFHFPIGLGILAFRIRQHDLDVHGFLNSMLMGPHCLLLVALHRNTFRAQLRHGHLALLHNWF